MRKDICSKKGCNRWIFSRRVKLGINTCSRHTKKVNLRKEGRLDRDTIQISPRQIWDHGHQEIDKISTEMLVT